MIKVRDYYLHAREKSNKQWNIKRKKRGQISLNGGIVELFFKDGITGTQTIRRYSYFFCRMAVIAVCVVPDICFASPMVAGRRNYTIYLVSSKDIMSLTEEATKVSGIPYVMDTYRKEAEKILSV